MSTLSPKESGEHIVANAKYLSVLQDGIQTIAKEVIKGIQDKTIDINNFSQHHLHPKATDEHALNWIFLIDTLNFCFWTPPGQPKWNVDNETGYFALCAAVNRAMREGIDITNPEFYSTITHPDLETILRADDDGTQCPLLHERVKCLHEVGKKLLAKYEGKFENCIKKANHSAKALLRLIVDEFPCFRDEGNFAGQRVAIYKRAQILVGDVWACYRGEGVGHFDDIVDITMFADYRVPQVLVHFGALKYSDDLMNKLLMADTLLANGSNEELEIRGASIYIVEKVKDAVLAEIRENHPTMDVRNFNSIVLDHFLWDYRRKHAVELEKIPFHKTISVYY